MAGKLAGKTLFITGASRGIGKAIALRAARDGANVTIAAKTATPHPKLPGTIYTAAEEVERLGGKCLPCIVDIRNEEEVNKAVEETVKKFGGIDILINNASAISLTNTNDTSMKTFDLMMRVNMRGTYLCSRACLPHLMKGKNPHILNLSPPLNLNPVWFRGHVAYTMSKYGMSMCVLGMAEEFKSHSIAVNALWPRTAIYTAAMEMLGGGEGIKDQCRTVDIMSDAAYVMLTKDSGSFTGNFCIDDEVLIEAGIKDLEKYSCAPGTKLMPDFFLDSDQMKDMSMLGGVLNVGGSKPEHGNTGPAKTFQNIKSILSDDLVESINGCFQFNLTGDNSGVWFIDLKTAPGAVGEGEAPGGADCNMDMDSGDFEKMFLGNLNPTMAFMSGKLKIKGDMGLAMKLEKLMKKVNAKL